MKKALFVAVLISLSTITFAQRSSPRKPAEDLNVDFMLRGYFFAG